MITIVQVRSRDAFFPSPKAAGRDKNKLLSSRTTPLFCDSSSYPVASASYIVLLLVYGLVISLVCYLARLYPRRKSDMNKERGEAHLQDFETKNDRKKEEQRNESEKCSFISDLSFSGKSRPSIRCNKRRAISIRSNTLSSISTRSYPSLPTISEDEQVLIVLMMMQMSVQEKI